MISRSRYRETQPDDLKMIMIIMIMIIIIIPVMILVMILIIIWMVGTWRLSPPLELPVSFLLCFESSSLLDQLCIIFLSFFQCVIRLIRITISLIILPPVSVVFHSSDLNYNLSIIAPPVAFESLNIIQSNTIVLNPPPSCIRQCVIQLI